MPSDYTRIDVGPSPHINDFERGSRSLEQCGCSICTGRQFGVLGKDGETVIDPVDELNLPYEQQYGTEELYEQPPAPPGYEYVMVPERPSGAPGERGWYSSREGLEQIQVNELWGLDFLEGSALKYLTRYKGKNGVEDLQKARFYIDRIIAREIREGRG